MSNQTRFLSRLLGLYCLLISCVMIAQPSANVELVTALLHDRPLLYVLGVILLFAGLAMVLLHNRWTGGAAPVMVSLIGWLTLFKGMLLVSLAPAQLSQIYQHSLHYAQLYPLYSALTLVLGMYLSYAGFRKS